MNSLSTAGRMETPAAAQPKSADFLLKAIAYLESQGRYFAAHPEKRSPSRDRIRAKNLAMYRAELALREVK